MEKEDRELLIKDLSARLAYGVMIQIPVTSYIKNIPNSIIDDILIGLDVHDGTFNYGSGYAFCKEDRLFTRKGDPRIKPYLRPMSSMTREERAELDEVIKSCGLSPYGEIKDCGEDNILRCTAKQAFLMLNYLYSKHFDVNHLIDKELALVAKEGMYSDLDND